MNAVFCKPAPFVVHGAGGFGRCLCWWCTWCWGGVALGEGTVITGDLNGQYIPTMPITNGYLPGRQALPMGLTRAWAGRCWACFAYYVASPFNLLYLFVPVAGFARMAGVVYGLKTVLACVLFQYMLCRKYPA